jgi:hypothetical protein
VKANETDEPDLGSPSPTEDQRADGRFEEDQQGDEQHLVGQHERLPGVPDEREW